MVSFRAKSRNLFCRACVNSYRRNAPMVSFRAKRSEVEESFLQSMRQFLPKECHYDVILNEVKDPISVQHQLLITRTSPVQIGAAGAKPPPTN